MKKCISCGGRLARVTGTNNGIQYSAFKCEECGEEVMNMRQAKRYMKVAEKAKQVTFSKWGQALAIRIPVDAVKAYKLKAKEKAKLILEKDGFKVLPIPT